MATYGQWTESLSEDDDLLIEVVGDDKNDKKRKTRTACVHIFKPQKELNITRNDHLVMLIPAFLILTQLTTPTAGTM